MSDPISVNTVDGEKLILDLDLVKEIRSLTDVLELDLYTGRTVTLAKTQELLNSIFKRTVSLEEAKKILAERVKR